MRVSKEKAAQNRERILSSAARLFREHGIGATGVDAITEDAGLTHGGLYSQFGSKKVIAAEAIRFALARGKRVWQRALERNPGMRAFPAIVDGIPVARTSRRARYWLRGRGPRHRHSQATASRSSSFHQRDKGRPRISVAADADDGNDSRYEDAIATFASMAGALILARAVNDEQLFRFDIEKHGEASDQACQATPSQAPPFLDARRYSVGTQKCDCGSDRSRRLHRRRNRKKIRRGRLYRFRGTTPGRQARAVGRRGRSKRRQNLGAIARRSQGRRPHRFSERRRQAAPLEVCIFNIGANVNFPIPRDDRPRVPQGLGDGLLPGFIAGREAARLMIPRGRGRFFFTAPPPACAAGLDTRRLRPQNSACAQLLRASRESSVRKISTSPSHHRRRCRYRMVATESGSARATRR